MPPESKIKPGNPRVAAFPQNVHQLIDTLAHVTASEGAGLLVLEAPADAAKALQTINPSVATPILASLSPNDLDAIARAAPDPVAKQWRLNLTFDEGTVGRVMRPAIAIFKEGTAIAEALAKLQDLVKEFFITYAYVVDEHDKLTGVVTMRELLFADHAADVTSIMIRKPFKVEASHKLSDLLDELVKMHLPVYPVVSDEGVLLGEVRGQAMFENQKVAISAQFGSTVGVGKEEKLTTSLMTSLRLRHPWLQVNLLTAFIAGAVVGLFEETIAQVVVLAAFLPVLAGQAGNTGAQALAVVVRAITLGDLKPGMTLQVLRKEMILGMFNGLLVGIIAGLVMLGYAIIAGAEQSPIVLALVVLGAMIGSCLLSGLSGALIPIMLKRLGVDPATASSIFLTTCTDIAALGLLLFLAAMFVV
ncbi:magnesium transporter [Mucisphaera sp.]|uniref:magnesium transporter n=1 Tax=Mucisphaera sp. TaxID=2913024 RepID=UPI003D0F30FD